MGVSLAHQEHLPHTLIPETPCKNKTRQVTAFLRQQEAIWAEKTTIRTEDKGKKPNHPTNTQMKKLFQQRQMGDGGVTAGHNGKSPERDHHNSSDTVRSQLISQLLCLHEKCCQPSLAFHSAQAPI